MASYTFGSEDFIRALIEAQDRDVLFYKYPVEFSRTDFRVFITILHNLAFYDEVSHKDIPSIPGYGEDGESEPIGDWASSWLSGIAETLGVEGI